MRVHVCKTLILGFFIVSVYGPVSPTFGQQEDCRCKKKPAAAMPPIISAAMKCDVRAVNQLIAGGALIETRDDEGDTSLKYAIKAKCDETG
jgi:hypothetical protein